jgi:hypothetical protein
METKLTVTGDIISKNTTLENEFIRNNTQDTSLNLIFNKLDLSTSHILPLTTNNISLGSQTFYFKDLYLGSDGIIFDNTHNIKKNNILNSLELSGNLQINGDLLVSGSKFNSSKWDSCGNDIYRLNTFIGINNSSPLFDLDVNGDINFTGDLYQDGNKFVASRWDISNNNIYRTNTKVGINNINPLFDLDISGDINLTGDLYQLGNKFVASRWDISDNNIYRNNTKVGINKIPTNELDVSGVINLNNKLLVDNSFIILKSDVIPDNNNISIGTPSNPIKHLYLSSNSLYINGEKVISADPNLELKITTSLNQNLSVITSGSGVLKLQSNNGNIILDTCGNNADININTAGMNSDINLSTNGAIKVSAPAGLQFNSQNYIKYNTSNQQLILKGNITVDGSLNVLGNQTIINTETVSIKDNLIELNSNQINNPPSTLESGIKINRGVQNYYKFIFKEDTQSFNVGISGNLQPVATRKDSTLMTEKGLLYWDNSNNRIDTFENIKFENGNLNLINNSKILINGNDIDASINNLQTQIINSSSQWTTNGNNIYYNTGNIGIGTTNPTTLLELSKAVSTIGDESLMIHFNNTHSTYFDWRLGATLTNGPNASFQLKGGANGTSLTTFINVDGGGNMGIGTTVPQRKLHLVGSGLRLDRDSNSVGLFISRFPTSYGETPFKTFFFGVNGYSSNNGEFVIDDFGSGLSGASTRRLTIDNSGNLLIHSGIGIGTNTPQQKLTISDDISPFLRFDRSGATRFDFEIGMPGTADLIFRGGFDGVGDQLTEFMRLSGGGNLGLGTDNPSVRLDVSGLIRIQQPHAYMRFQRHGETTSQGWNIGHTSSSENDFYIYGYNSGSGNGNIRLFTQASERLRITSTGNVGVGTTNPEYGFEVQRSSGATNLGVSYLSGRYSNLFAGSTFSGINFDQNGYFSLSSGSTKTSTNNSGLIISGTNNVGIGITNPGAKLEIVQGGTSWNVKAIFGRGQDTNFQTIVYEDRTSNNTNSVVGGFGMIYGTTYNSSIRFHRGDGSTNGFLSLSTAQAERLRITNLGNVGIGTTSPSQRLHVNGNTTLIGNVGIGITNPTYNLDVSGNINFTGDLFKNGVIFEAGGGSSQWENSGNDIYYNLGNVSIFGDLNISGNILENGNSITQQLNDISELIYGNETIDGIKITLEDVEIRLNDISELIYGTENIVGIKSILEDINDYNVSSWQLNGSHLYYNRGVVEINDNLLGIPSNGVLGSNGTRLILSQGSTTTTPYALGNNTNTLWYGVPVGATHRWYSGINEIMTLDISGRLGVGVSVPNSTLHVRGTDNNINTLNIELPTNVNASWRSFRIRGTSLWGDGITTFNSANIYTLGTLYGTVENFMFRNPHIVADAGSTARMRFGRAGGVSTGTWWEIGTLTTGDYWISREANATNRILFTQTGGIIANGSVGIGVTAPLNSLHVEGTVTGEHGIRIRNLSNNSGAYSIIRMPNDTNTGLVAFINSSTRTTDGPANSVTFRNDAGQLRLMSHGNNNLNLWTNSVERFTVLGNGNVGIGSTVPTYNLDVNGNINFTGTLFNNGVAFSGSEWNVSGNDINYTLGNVGIGTTVIENTLTVNGVLQLNTAGGIDPTKYGIYSFDGKLFINPRNSTGQYNNIIGLIIDNSGNVGINTTTPNYELDVNGDIYASGDINAFSDGRYKENIINLENSLDKVCNLRGVYYNFVGDNTKKIGMIAQEVEEYFPELVSTKETKSLNYQNMTAVLVEAIKELNNKNNNLEKENKELKKEINDLKLKIDIIMKSLNL